MRLKKVAERDRRALLLNRREGGGCKLQLVNRIGNVKLMDFGDVFNNGSQKTDGNRLQFPLR